MVVLFLFLDFSSCQNLGNLGNCFSRRRILRGVSLLFPSFCLCYFLEFLYQSGVINLFFFSEFSEDISYLDSPSENVSVVCDVCGLSCDSIVEMVYHFADSHPDNC